MDGYAPTTVNIRRGSKVLFHISHLVLRRLLNLSLHTVIEGEGGPTAKGIPHGLPHGCHAS
jgi:hypothetical protein